MNTTETGRLSGLLPILGIVALVSFGFALYSSLRVRQAQAEADAATRAHESDFKKIQELTAQVREGERKQTALEADVTTQQQAAEKARAETAAAVARTAARPGPGGPPDAAAAREKQRADGREFLARFGAQAREPLLVLGRGQIARNYAALFRSGVLTPAQIESLQSATAEHWLETLELGPNGIHPGEGSLKDDDVKRVLGDDGFQRYQEFRRTQPLQGALNDISSMSIYAPLSAEQSSKLLDTIANATSGFKEGGKITPQGTDWNQVVTQSQAFLSPAQVEAVKAHAQFPQVDVLMKKFYEGNPKQ